MTGFDAWYKIYPRHVAKLDAQRAYNAAIKKGVTHDVLLSGARAFASLCSVRGTDKSYIPYPASWLRAGQWEDEDLGGLPGGSVGPLFRPEPSPTWNGTRGHLTEALGPSGTGLFLAYFAECQLNGNVILAPTEARRHMILNRFEHKLAALGLSVAVK